MTTRSFGSRFARPVAFLFTVLLASLAFVMASASPAHADEVNTDQYDYVFAGNVKYGDEPLSGVVINVSGNGYDVDVRTDEKGQWKVGVPENAAYDITVLESTLPLGVTVTVRDDDRMTRTAKGLTINADFGLTDRKSVNFFLGEREREAASPSPDNTKAAAVPDNTDAPATTGTNTSTVIITGLSGLCVLLLGYSIVLTVLLLRKPKAATTPAP